MRKCKANCLDPGALRVFSKKYLRISTDIHKVQVTVFKPPPARWALPKASPPPAYLLWLLVCQDSEVSIPLMRHSRSYHILLASAPTTLCRCYSSHLLTVSLLTLDGTSLDSGLAESHPSPDSCMCRTAWTQVFRKRKERREIIVLNLMSFLFSSPSPP